MKKKMAAVLLSTMIGAVIAISTFAADVDLNDMTVEELCELRNNIDLKLEELFGSDGEIGEGQFVVGTEIKAGTYQFTCTYADVDVYGNGMNISLYADQEAFDNRESINKGNVGYLNVGGVMTLILKDGMIMTIDDGNGVLTTQAPSWSP